MFRSPMWLSSGISLFTSLLMLLMLKWWIAKYFKYFKNFNISNINKEVSEEIPVDDLTEDRNILDYFLKVFLVILI